MSDYKTERITRDQIEKYLDEHDPAEMSATCAEIVGKLCDKAEEFSNYYMEMKRLYPELFVITDIGMICTVSAAPFARTNKPPVNILLGTTEAITIVSNHIIDAIKEIVNGKNDKPAA